MGTKLIRNAVPRSGGTFTGDVTFGDNTTFENHLTVNSGVRLHFGSSGNTFIREGALDSDLDIASSDDLNITSVRGTTIDSGRNIIIDSGTGVISLEDDGGTYTPANPSDATTKRYVDSNWIWHQSMRGYTRYDNWYHPSVYYGPTYYQWNSSTGSAGSLPTTWPDSYNPCIVAPFNTSIKSYLFTGNFTSTCSAEFALLLGTGLTYGSAGSWSFAQIGSTQSGNYTGGIQYQIGENVDVAIGKGTILLPCLRRTTDDNSTYIYFEGNFSMIFHY